MFLLVEERISSDIGHSGLWIYGEMGRCPRLFLSDTSNFPCWFLEPQKITICLAKFHCYNDIGPFKCSKLLLNWKYLLKAAPGFWNKHHSLIYLLNISNFHPIHKTKLNFQFDLRQIGITISLTKLRIDFDCTLLKGFMHFRFNECKLGNSNTSSRIKSVYFKWNVIFTYQIAAFNGVISLIQQW